MNTRAAVIVASAVLLAGVLVTGAVVATRHESPGNGAQSLHPGGPGSASRPTSQHVEGQFSIYTNRWFETIPGTEWNRCDGEPECDGSECYGVGPANGLGFSSSVLVTDGSGQKVALGSVLDTWGWKRATTKGACILHWAVDVPVVEDGVLTVIFNDSPNWSADFTLKEMRSAPHKLDLYGLGDLDS